MNECAPDTAKGLPMREAFLLHRRQHGEDALPALVLDGGRTADGPGRYRLIRAIMSSRFCGCRPTSTCFMPEDSSWNTPSVSPCPSIL